MKILQINSASNWAGGEVHTHLLCKELAKRGYDVTLACRRNSAISQMFEKDGLRTLHLNLRGGADIVSAFRMAEYCRQRGIQIVHAHLGRDYWLTFWMQYFNPSVRIIFTRHVLFSLKQSFFHRLMFSKVARIIAVSSAVKQVMLEKNGISEGKVVVIHNGIDVDGFKLAKPAHLREELGLDPNTKIVGIIGQLSPHKGQDVLIQSIPLILKHCPNVAFLFVGADFKQGRYVKELESLAESLQVRDSIHFLGERTNVPELLKDFDVFVSSSKAESFGLVIAESMAAGIPVVATRQGGALEIIEDGKTGLLFPYGDFERLAEKVLFLIDNPAICQSISTRAFTRVQSLFSKDIMMQRLIDAYSQCFK